MYRSIIIVSYLNIFTAEMDEDHNIWRGEMGGEPQL